MGPAALLVEKYTCYLEVKGYIGASSGELYSQLTQCQGNADPPKH